MWVFGWNIALQWVRNGHSNEEIAEKHPCFSFKRVKARWTEGLVTVFFLLALDSPVRKTSGRLFQRPFGRKLIRFCNQLEFSPSFKFHTFPGISQNLPENVSFFSEIIDLCLLTQKNQTLQGVFGWTIALWQKVWARDRPISVEVYGSARNACALRPGRSIPVAIFLNHDAQIAAQTTRFWLRSELP